MSKAKISVIIKKPGEKPYHTNISPSLENLQILVGGYIESVSLLAKTAIICNEEGRINGMPYNCNICGVDFYGVIIFAGVNGAEFADLPCDFKTFKQIFKRLFD